MATEKKAPKREACLLCQGTGGCGTYEWIPCSACNGTGITPRPPEELLCRCNEKIMSDGKFQAKIRTAKATFTIHACSETCLRESVVDFALEHPLAEFL